MEGAEHGWHRRPASQQAGRRWCVRFFVRTARATASTLAYVRTSVLVRVSREKARSLRAAAALCVCVCVCLPCPAERPALTPSTLPPGAWRCRRQMGRRTCGRMLHSSSRPTRAPARLAAGGRKLAYPRCRSPSSADLPSNDLFAFFVARF